MKENLLSLLFQRNYLNPLTPGAFLPKTRFLDILVVLKLDLGQISFNLVKKAFATGQLALLATGIPFQEILTRACVEIKILRESDLLL